jgi:hypothetical protein
MARVVLRGGGVLEHSVLERSVLERSVRVSPGCTVAGLKAIVSRWYAVPPERQLLLYHGRQLTDEQDLVDLLAGLQDTLLVHWTTKVRTATGPMHDPLDCEHHVPHCFDSSHDDCSIA